MVLPICWYFIRRREDLKDIKKKAVTLDEEKNRIAVLTKERKNKRYTVKPTCTNYILIILTIFGNK